MVMKEMKKTEYLKLCLLNLVFLSFFFTEVPDDFYNLGPSDFAALKAAAGKKSDEPLMTREFREKKALATFQKFSKTNIRVRFPNRWELQGTFLSSESTAQLYEFVKKHITHSDRAFELYTTPPKIALPQTSFLRQKLVPAAIVYFSFVDKKEEVSSYLTEEAMTNLSGSAKHQLSTFSKQEPVDYTVSKNSNNGPPPKDKGEKKKGNAPSWFKLGK